MAAAIILQGILGDDFLKLNNTVVSKLETYIKAQDETISDLSTKLSESKAAGDELRDAHEKELQSRSTQLEEATKSLENFQSEITNLEKKLQFSANEIENARDEHQVVVAQLGGLEVLVNDLQQEKSQLSELLDKKEAQIEKHVEFMKSLKDQLATVTQAKYDSMVKLEEYEIKDLNYQHQRKCLEQERDLAQQQVLALNQELSEKQQEMLRVRKEKSTSVLELQADLEEKITEARVAQDRTSDLKKQLIEKDRNAERLAAKVKELRHANISAEEQFEQELQAVKKLSDIYKKNAEDAQTKIEELVRNMEDMHKAMKECNTSSMILEQSLKESEEDLIKKLEERDAEISDLRLELERANNLLSKCKDLGYSEENVKEMFPAAAATSKVLKSGMSLTQIYSELVKTQEDLQMERLENKKLNEQLQQILEEIEEKTPVFNRKIQEYMKALDTITSLKNQLNTCLMEQERLQSERDEATRKTGFLQREHDRMKSLASDLSLQVRSLLKEIHEANGGPVVQEVSSAIDAANASGIITQHLVTFKDIQELQEKNQQLLAVVRDLSEQIEDTEKRASELNSADLKEQLVAAMKQLDQLQEERRHQSTLVESVIRQKDMYKSLVGQYQGSPMKTSPLLSSTPGSKAQLNQSQEDSRKFVEAVENLKGLQEEFDSYRKEKQHDQRLLSDQLDKFREELSEARIQNAKLTSELEYNQERIVQAQSKAENYKKEVTMFREKSQKYSTSAVQHQQTIGILRQDVLLLQEKNAKAEITIQNLQAERELLKATEIRLLQDKESLIREQQSHAKLASNLQAVQMNLERMESDSKHSMKHQIEKLEQEISALKGKLGLEEENYKSAVKAWEKKSSDIDERLLVEVGKNNKLNEDLIEAYSQLHQTKLDLSANQAKLNAAQNRVDQMRANQDDGKTGLELKNLQNQLNEAKREIAVFKEKLQHAQKTTDKYRSMADDLEKHVKEEGQISKQCNESMEKTITEQKQTIEKIESDLELKEQELSEIKEEFNKLNYDRSQNVKAMEDQVSSLKHELEMSLSLVEVAKKIEQDAQQDRQAQARLVTEAQEQYQRELQQHAADVKELSSLRETIEATKNDLACVMEINRSLQETISENQASFEKQKEIMANQVSSANEKCKDLESQSNSLFQQLELMSSQLAAIKSSDWSKIPSIPTEGGTECHSMEHLMEVVRYLRKEKEIAVASNDTTQAEANRLKMKVAFLERKLGDLEKELTEEKSQAQATAATESQHRELLRKVEMLNLLTESNRLLRDEKDASVKRCEILEGQVKQLEGQLGPLQRSVKELTARLDQTSSEAMALRSEVKKWQSRSAQLLEQSKKHDPEDFKRLQEENTNLKLQVTVLTEESSRLKAEVSKQGAAIAELQKELSATKQASEQEKNSNKGLEQELQTSKNESLEHQKTILQVKKIARKYKTEYTELKTQHDEFVAKANVSNEASSALAAQQEEQIRSELQQETERKLKEGEDKIKKVEEELEKTKQELTRLVKKEENNKLQEDRLKKLIMQAKKKIHMLSGERDGLKKEKNDQIRINEELKAKIVTLEQHSEEDNLRVNSIKSQFEAKVKKLEMELKALRDSRERLEKQMEEVARKQASRPSTSAGPVERASSTISESPLMANIRPLTPPVVSSGASGSLRHPPHSHQSTSTARSTPTASIRPMAIGTSVSASTVVPSHQASSRTATVTPTTAAALSMVTESETLPVTTVHVLPSVPQATVQPTPAVVATFSVAPSTSSHSEPPLVEVASSRSSLEDQRSANDTEDSCSSSLPSVSVVSTSPQTQVVTPTVKRQREDTEAQSSSVISRESDSPDTTGQTHVPQVKRIRMVGDTSITVERASVVTSGTSLAIPIESTVVESSRVTHQVESTTSAATSSNRDDHPSTTQLPKPQEEILPDRPGVIVTPEPQTTPALPESSSTQSAPESERPEKVEISTLDPNGDVIISHMHDTDSQNSLEERLDDKAIESTSKSPLPDFEDKVSKSFGIPDDFNEDEVVEEDDDDEGMVEDDVSYGDEEQMPEVENYSQEEDEEDMDNELPFEQEVEEMADPSDDVEIDEESEMEATSSCHPTSISDVLDTGYGQIESSSAMITGTGISSSATLTSTITDPPEIGHPLTPSLSNRPPILPRGPHRSEQLIGRQQLPPFSIPGQSSNFEDGDDSIVPSTPTLFVPRRGDGFAEVSSPHVQQGRFLFTNTSDSGNQGLLASQGALGVDDTRMDLTQFDEGSGRSVPTTPLQVSPPADAIITSDLPDLSSITQSRITSVGDHQVSSTRNIPTITVTPNEDQTLTIQEELAESSTNNDSAPTSESAPVIEEEGQEEETPLVSSQSEIEGGPIIVEVLLLGDPEGGADNPEGEATAVPVVEGVDAGTSGEGSASKSQPPTQRKPITWEKPSKPPAGPSSSPSGPTSGPPAAGPPAQFPHPPPRMGRGEGMPRGRRLRLRGGPGANYATRGNPNYQSFHWRGRGARGGPPP